MNGNDVARRMGWMRTEGRALSKLALLWRGKPEATTATAAECAKQAKDPLRRFDPLRRRGEEAPTPFQPGIH
ncbi:hypothetical protein [Roseomonas xinghualingensis]|uniref:hypothetical protein n=1 Tax=Roseomonas xinghualingensis TaxID=2986475 RepID=UPI0021F22660|nr:hypothetical protein [Roseomonas sp. SXEYE001]MCV4207200.1 hypothetical protein [Roseomonas sp. SXEYE001]